MLLDKHTGDMRRMNHSYLAEIMSLEDDIIFTSQPKKSRCSVDVLVVTTKKVTSNMCCSTSSASTNGEYLLHLLGCNGGEVERPNLKLVHVDWEKVGELLNTESENDEQNSSTRIAHSQASTFPYSPLKIAVYNELSPVPGHIIKAMLHMWPEESTADIDTTFKIACGNKNIQLDAIQALLDYQSDLLTHWSLRHVASSKNKRVAQFIVRNYSDCLPSTWEDWALVFGLTQQAFWLEIMLHSGSHLSSFEFVMETHLLHFFVSQSNLDAVRLIVQAYPQTLSVRKNGKLPLHVALSSYEGRGYGWNKQLVLYLLQEGLRLGVGSDDSQNANADAVLGGLYCKDYNGMTPLDSAIDMVRRTAFSCNLVFGERWHCLVACITFANDYRRGHDHDSIFHAALRVIPTAFDILQLIVQKYNINVGDPCIDGMNSVHIAIDGISNVKRMLTNDDCSNLRKLFSMLLTPDGFPGSSFSLAKEKFQGRTPLSMAAMRGLSFHCGLKEIIDAHPTYLEEKDPNTLAYPFIMATNSVNSTYDLLRVHINPFLDCVT